MSVQRFAGIDVVDAPSASYTAIANTVTRTVLFPGKVAAPIPAYDLRGGKKYVLEMGGIVSHTAAATMIFDPLIGVNGTTADTTLGASVAAPAPVGTTIANVSWMLQFTLTCRTIGVAASTAAVTGNGYAIIAGNATTLAGIPPISFGGLTSVATVDQTVANYLDIAFTWGAASASNTITCQWATLETRN